MTGHSECLPGECGVCDRARYSTRPTWQIPSSALPPPVIYLVMANIAGENDQVVLEAWGIAQQAEIAVDRITREDAEAENAKIDQQARIEEIRTRVAAENPGQGACDIVGKTIEAIKPMLTAEGVRTGSNFDRVWWVEVVIGEKYRRPV